MSTIVVDLKHGLSKVSPGLSHGRAVASAKLIAAMLQCRCVVARRRAHWCVYRSQVADGARVWILN